MPIVYPAGQFSVLPSMEERKERLDNLIREAYEIYDYAIYDQVISEKMKVKATIPLFSGGIDSTILAHLFKDRATHIFHGNTGIGIRDTHEYVASCASKWGLPYIELSPRGNNTYEQRIIEQGFPGPGLHNITYTRLKQRQFERCLTMINKTPLSTRVVFLSGRRRDESKRRKNSVKEYDRRGSAIYVSPLRNWTKIDMNTYRILNPDLPHNPVTDILHMSGECMCGCYASPEERPIIRQFYGELEDEIQRLERIATKLGHEKNVWGMEGRGVCNSGCNT